MSDDKIVPITKKKKRRLEVIFKCECGCISFNLMKNRKIRCAECGMIASNGHFVMDGK